MADQPQGPTQAEGPSPLDGLLTALGLQHAQQGAALAMQHGQEKAQLQAQQAQLAARQTTQKTIQKFQQSTQKAQLQAKIDAAKNQPEQPGPSYPQANSNLNLANPMANVQGGIPTSYEDLMGRVAGGGGAQAALPGLAAGQGPAAGGAPSVIPQAPGAQPAGPPPGAPPQGGMPQAPPFLLRGNVQSTQEPFQFAPGRNVMIPRTTTDVGAVSNALTPEGIIRAELLSHHYDVQQQLGIMRNQATMTSSLGRMGYTDVGKVNAYTQAWAAGDEEAKDRIARELQQTDNWHKDRTILEASRVRSEVDKNSQIAARYAADNAFAAQNGVPPSAIPTMFHQSFAAQADLEKQPLTVQTGITPRGARLPTGPGLSKLLQPPIPAVEGGILSGGAKPAKVAAGSLVGTDGKIPGNRVQDLNTAVYAWLNNGTAVHVPTIQYDKQGNAMPVDAKGIYGTPMASLVTALNTVEKGFDQKNLDAPEVKNAEAVLAKSGFFPIGQNGHVVTDTGSPWPIDLRDTINRTVQEGVFGYYKIQRARMGQAAPSAGGGTPQAAPGGGAVAQQ